MFLEHCSQGICNLHVQHGSTQNKKQPEIYKIKDGLHELGGDGQNEGNRGQMFCKDSLVLVSVWSSENLKKTFH